MRVAPKAQVAWSEFEALREYPRGMQRCGLTQERHRTRTSLSCPGGAPLLLLSSSASGWHRRRGCEQRPKRRGRSSTRGWRSIAVGIETHGMRKTVGLSRIVVPDRTRITLIACHHAPFVQKIQISSSEYLASRASSAAKSHL